MLWDQTNVVDSLNPVFHDCLQKGCLGQNPYEKFLAVNGEMLPFFSKSKTMSKEITKCLALNRLVIDKSGCSSGVVKH